MRYGTTISLAGLLLAATAFAGCGKVENGVCPGDQADTVACTVDLCDFEAKSWVHIPDDSLCDKGQRCDATMGCVAAGGLTGHAYLFGHSDHSGITVTVDGLEGGTTMTDKDGNWSFGGLPTGTFNLTYSKDKFIAQKQTGVSVFPEAASSPDAVTLTHGVNLGQDKVVDYATGIYLGDRYNASTLSPDKKHVVVRYAHVYDDEIIAYSLDTLSSAPVPMFTNPGFDPCVVYNCYNYGYPYYVTNSHVVWAPNPSAGANQTVWSRGYDGSPPVILGAVFGTDYLQVMGTPGPYVVLRKVHDNGSFSETSLYVVKVDGSTPMGAPAWVQPDAQHTLAYVVNNDTTALFAVNNSSASPPTDSQANTPLHRIDLATSALSNVNTAFATNDNSAFSVSPDGAYLFGYLHQNAPTSWFRSFLIPISGTAGPALAPDYGAGATQYSDRANGAVQWFSDSSGVVFQTYSYGPTAGGTAEGQLKVWATTRATSTTLVPINAYTGWTVHNKVVVYRDPSVAGSPLKVVSAHSATPVIYTLDANPSAVYLQDFTFDDIAGNSSYFVWTDSVSSGDATRQKIFSALMPDPLLAAPAAVQLGGALAADCAFEAVLSDRTYWQLCQKTGTLSGFLQSTTAAGTTTGMVRPGLIALPSADRVAFRRYDGKLYSSPDTGSLTDVKLVSNVWDPMIPLKAYGKWVLLTDTDGGYLRASNADGSSIDEPQSTCRFFQKIPYYGDNIAWQQPFSDPANTTVLFPGIRCPNEKYGEYQVPTTNLP